MDDLRRMHANIEAMEATLGATLIQVAELLSTDPQAREPDQIDAAWQAANSQRRKLAQFLRRTERDPRDIVSDTKQAKASKRRLDSVAKRLGYWTRFEEHLPALARPKRRALLQDQVPLRRDVLVVDHVLAKFLDAMHQLANPNAHSQSPLAYQKGFHADIPLPMTQFSSLIGAAYRLCLAMGKTAPLRFLDVGSGGGTKVFAATTIFDHCDGLEYEASFVESGTAFLNQLAPDTCRLLHGDALRFDGYGRYDVIYFFRPVTGTETISAMENQMFSQVPDGTVLLAAGELISPDLDARGVQKLANGVYLTGKTRNQADALLDHAEHLSTMVPGHGRRPIAELGYWTPLHDSFIRNGVQI